MRHLASDRDLRDFLDDHRDLRRAVWDFDGVIVDSEPVHATTYRDILGRLGHEPPQDFFEGLAGRSEGEIWDALIERFGLELSAEELQEERGPLASERLRRTAPNWFVLPLLDELDRRGIASRIVSSGNGAVVRDYLRAQGLEARFSDVSVVDGIAPPTKPGRLTAAVGDGEGVLLIEDTGRYVDIARELGALTIGVRHSVNSAADLAVDAVVNGGAAA